MSTIVWLLVWAAVIGTLAFFTIREVRGRKKQPPEFDRFQHEAVRQASRDEETRGPNGIDGLGF